MLIVKYKLLCHTNYILCQVNSKIVLQHSQGLSFLAIGKNPGSAFRVHPPVPNW